MEYRPVENRRSGDRTKTDLGDFFRDEIGRKSDLCKSPWTESYRISTCAKSPFAQVAFSSDFFRGPVPTTTRLNAGPESVWRRRVGRRERHAYATVQQLGEHNDQNREIHSPRCLITCAMAKAPDSPALAGPAKPKTVSFRPTHQCHVRVANVHSARRLRRLEVGVHSAL